MNNNKSKISCNGGFTLIELLVVVLIIGILAAVAVPQYQKAVLKSRLVQMQVYMDALRKGAEMYFLENGNYKTTLENFDIDIESIAQKVAPSTFASNTKGAFFDHDIECISNWYVIACMSPEFYLIRKHDHATGVDWPNGLACQGLTNQAGQICLTMSTGEEATAYSDSEHKAYIIGN